MDRGEWDEAERLLAQAVSTCKVDPEARRNYAEALWRRGEVDQATAQLEEAVRLAGGDPTVRVRLSEMRLALGDADAALMQAETAASLDPNSAPAWTAIGRAKLRLGNADEALAALHRAVSIDPGNREALLDLAAFNLRIGKPRLALGHARSVLDHSLPGEEPPAALLLAGQAHATVGQTHEAATLYQQAQARGAAPAECLALWGEAELIAGNRAAADGAARQALAHDPHNPRAHGLLARLGGGPRDPRLAQQAPMAQSVPPLQPAPAADAGRF